MNFLRNFLFKLGSYLKKFKIQAASILPKSSKTERTDEKCSKFVKASLSLLAKKCQRHDKIFFEFLQSKNRLKHSKLLIEKVAQKMTEKPENFCFQFDISFI